MIEEKAATKCDRESGDCIRNPKFHPKDYCKFCHVKATIHVNIPGEGFWALKTHDPKIVCLNNQPLAEGYNLYDMYEYHGGDLGKLIEQGSDTVHAKYDTGENIEETWKEKLRPYLVKLEEDGVILGYEGMLAGFVSLAMPVGQGENIDLLCKIQEESPTGMDIEPVWLHDNAEEDDG